MSDAPVIHASAIVDPGAEIGAGTRIWHFCHVMAGARIGRACVLGQNVFVAGSVRIGSGCRIQNNVSLFDGVELCNDVFIGPSAVFTNVSRPRAGFPRRDLFERTLVGSGATIGANATVRCGITVGEGAFVAAGAVVTRSVPPFVLVQGVPARASGFVCRCGESVGAPTFRCPGCGEGYVLEAFGLRPGDP
jgi:UDP-2-acetamido-3-amino-2,3-dideoxy-glucuronate N-acetyltransferase